MPLTISGHDVSPFSILLAVLASMGGFIFGYDTGQISNILLMPDFLLRFAVCTGTADPATQCAFYPAIEGLIVALLSVGTAIGALCGAPVADGLGRTRAMSIECAIFSAGVLIQVTAFNAWYQVAIGRLISGLGIGALSAAVPMYQAETAPKQIRGTLTGTYQLFITFGILVAYLISLGTRALTPSSASWRIVIALGLVWAVVLGVGILFMPESPRWLIQRGRLDEARASISRTHGPGAKSAEDVEAEFDEIRQAVELEAKLASATWLDCFSPRHKTLYRTLLGMSLQSLQQLTGANYFFYYGATIMQAVGIQDSFVTQIIFGAINFGCTFLGLYVMERFGRRWPLILGGVWQAAWLFVFAAAGTAAGDPASDPAMGRLMIVAACLFILGYASTWAPGIWILIGETFPTRTRAKQGALSTMSNWVWNFLLAFFTPFIVSAISYRFGFVFASCNLLGALVAFCFLYESGGLSLEAVDRMYNSEAVRPWTRPRTQNTERKERDAPA
ncbi:general substrate transporter [Calocera cornea HHB12733]|uniref:General substrate transporter n=1 Tax=Calocera cornea HHB12733 TaxID=1353952 RepID=A0A165F4S0_9BASI|nr:general substrate transporter [Calocera cornea HHB12733]